MTLNPLAPADYRQGVGTSPLHLTLNLTTQIPYLLFNPSAYPLKGALFLDIKRMADGHWLATHPQIMTHGVGDTPDMAARDFHNMLLDRFRALLDSEKVLAPHLRQELECLKTLV
jgi:hypothetical protein